MRIHHNSANSMRRSRRIMLLDNDNDVTTIPTVLSIASSPIIVISHTADTYSHTHTYINSSQNTTPHDGVIWFARNSTRILYVRFLFLLWFTRSVNDRSTKNARHATRQRTILLRRRPRRICRLHLVKVGKEGKFAHTLLIIVLGLCVCSPWCWLYVYLCVCCVMRERKSDLIPTRRLCVWIWFDCVSAFVFVCMISIGSNHQQNKQWEMRKQQLLNKWLFFKLLLLNREREHKEKRSSVAKSTFFYKTIGDFYINRFAAITRKKRKIDNFVWFCLRNLKTIFFSFA